MRSDTLCLLVLLISGLAGCGPGSDKPAATGTGGGKAVSAAEARKELMDTAEKMEGILAINVASVVQAVESGGWPWSVADKEFRPGGFSPETIAAYQKWRTAKLAEDGKKK